MILDLCLLSNEHGFFGLFLLDKNDVCLICNNFLDSCKDM